MKIQSEKELIINPQNIVIRNLLKMNGYGKVPEEIIKGLRAENKYISSKFFYNSKGSELFEEITGLKEYYPTRTEKSILYECAPALVRNIEDMDIIELGSGDSSKISILLEAIPEHKMPSIRYIPVDVSESAIRASASALRTKFPRLEINGYVMDFTSQMKEIHRDRPALICFFGSTLGNFNREDAVSLLKNISSMMQKGDVFVIGLDMVKPTDVLHAAYNDSRRVTAAFNKNILEVVNDHIGSDFSLDDFAHLAFYNNAESRIEMHLQAQNDVVIKSPQLSRDIEIAKGETIHTENSNKYNPEDIEEIGQLTALEVKSIFSDSQNWFTLTTFEKG